MDTNDCSSSIDPNPIPTAPPRRRWLTYSLRSLTALMFLACVGFAWFGFHWREKQKERAAVAALGEFGGTVVYDYQYHKDGEWNYSLPDPPGPAWQRTLLGNDWLTTPQGLDLSGTQVTDADLVHLRELKQLQWLNLNE
ncbi:MAG: hypothetical protein N2C14_08180, partial [Planctomycetales bacterium]